VRRLALLATVVGALLLPQSIGPVQGQEPKSTREQRAEVRKRKGEVKVEVDLLKAKQADIQAALNALAANVAAQQGQVEESKRAAAAAAEDVVEANAAVSEAQARIVRLDQATDDFVTMAFVNPPGDNALDAFMADSLSDASLKQTLLDIQADSDADVLDQLNEAHEDLELEKANKEAVAADAEAKRVAAEDQLAQLQAAQAQQAAFAAEAEAALDHKLTESQNLASLDSQLSAQIAAEQAALARQMGRNGYSSPGGPGSLGSVPGGVETVTCPNGGAFTIAGDIAGSVQELLEDADAAGLALCGWGWRSGEQQVELRRQHCGGSDYDIWQKPSGSCSPPTARPGLSMHERGLAVDFTCSGSGIGSHGNSCYRWLARHAGSYGLYNLPSEPWHWSTTGK
jgi:hypothetical protein